MENSAKRRLSSLRALHLHNFHHGRVLGPRSIHEFGGFGLYVRSLYALC